jgi:hypothetical protein
MLVFWTNGGGVELLLGIKYTFIMKNLPILGDSSCFSLTFRLVVQVLGSALFLGATGAYAQTGNYVPSGGEASAFGPVSLGSTTSWTTNRSSAPGYFAAVGSAGQFTNADDSHNVDGYVKHYANASNQSFTFPVGTGTDLRSLVVSGTRSASSVIGVAWIGGNPSSTSDPTLPNSGFHAVTSRAPGLASVSTTGQWDWQDISGNSAGTTITVSIPNLTAFGPASLLRLVAWDGAKWVDITTGTATGNTENSALSGKAIAGMTAIGIGLGADTDGDGIPDLTDTDDDGDGIPDLLEGDGSVDTDGDGIPDSLDLDSDNDGIPDSVERGSGPTPIDTDGDGIADFRDLDSDNDGINDVREAGGTDANGDGRADGTPNTNGIPSSAGPNGITNPPDTDGDGRKDYVDLDSDGDSVPDLWENGNKAADTNGDGFLGSADGATDTDNDGIMSPVDGLPNTWGDGSDPAPKDADNDGTPDYKDLDSDADGITDLVEAGRNPALIDTNNDGKVDNQTDTDGDGIADAVDSNNSQFGGAIPTTPFVDTDGDGIPDVVDPDDDNDGIPDLEEGDGGIDTDGDGIPDSRDSDSDNDGIPDAVEYANAINGGDTDGDGVKDWRDLDSDNDGINDVREAGGVDANGDGRADGSLNANGIPSSAGPNGITNPPDTDGDGRKDYVDLDSDGDSIPDLWENNGGTKPAYDTNGDGFMSAADGATDADHDGIMSPVDGLPNSWGDASDPAPKDTDNDGSPDYRDLDSDGDGVKDIVEAGNAGLDSNGDGKADGGDNDGDGLTDNADTDDSKFGGALPLKDTDGDGIPDLTDTDDDGDGIPDVLEGDGSVDTDGDGIPDSRDSDSDNDGIPDSVEKGSGPAPVDTDGDGIADFRDLDSDNDGINDVREAGGTDANGDGRADGPPNSKGIPSSAGPNGITNPPDTDGDGRKDYVDLDSDGDSVPDLWENGNKAADTNGDGFLSAADGAMDTDHDGIMSPVDGLPNSWGDASDSAPKDTDNDGTPDYKDLDSDNDGITDLVEAGRDPAAIDTNNDGKVDDQTDADGDGIADPVDTNDSQFGGAQPTTGLTDTDGDGIPDVIDTDDDNDGIPDVDEGDGSIDTDGDGIPDSRDSDSDNDGIPDALELANAINGGDTDGDGVKDWRDLDSDNDGIYDVVEAGHAGVDANKDGRIDTPVGSNGLADIVETTPGSGIINYVPRDTDGDGRKDYIDLDSDNDTISDLLESGNQGVSDSDNDGIADGTPNSNGIVPGAGSVNPVDTDGDGTKDYVDPDSNNDGIKDIVDNGYGNQDSNGDGKVDNATDSDGDGVPNVIDTENGNFGGLPPAGYNQWLIANPADTDHDVFPIMQEYAFGGTPLKGDHLVNGTSRRQGLVITKNAAGGVDASFVRPRGRFDVTYTLQLSQDLVSWVNVSGLPTVIANGDGTDTISWTNVQSVSPATVSRGFVRLKISTSTSVTPAFTLPQGWTKQAIVGRQQTHGVNFTSPPVFTGKVNWAVGIALGVSSSSSGSDIGGFLTAPDKYYIEFTDGVAEGHRLDLMGGAIDTLILDLASSNNTSNVLPAGIANSHFVIRKHRTLGEVFLNTEWASSSSVANADQIQFFNGTGFDIYFNFPNNAWVKQGAGFASRNDLIITPGHAVNLIHANANGDNSVLQFGEVRYNAFIRPAKQGVNLVASGYPLDASPASLGLTTSNGFAASSVLANATQIQNWTGDVVPNTSGYVTSFQIADANWRVVNNLAIVTTSSPLFQNGRGTILKAIADSPAWKHALPWNPTPWVQP